MFFLSILIGNLQLTSLYSEWPYLKYVGLVEREYKEEEKVKDDRLLTEE